MSRHGSICHSQSVKVERIAENCNIIVTLLSGRQMKLIGFSWKQDAVNGHQSLSNELELVSELQSTRYQ